MAAPDLDIIKDVPGYKVILKAVLKSQIQQLVEQLAATAEEESVILTASVADGTLSHLGSSSGKGFLEDHEDIKSQFLGFCLKKHHRDQQEKERLEAEAAINQARLAAARQVSSHGHYLSRSPRFTSPGHGPVHPVTLTRTPRGRGIRSPANRHEPYSSARPPRRTSTEPSPARAESDNGQFIKIEPNLESSDNENHDSNQTSQDNAPSVSKSESGEREDDAKSESSNSTIPNEAQAEGLGLDSDLSNIIAGSSQSQGSESGEIDANVSVKMEAISESDMELEITGVEPGRPLPQDTWDPNMSMGMNFDPSQGAAGNQADMTGPGYTDDIHPLQLIANNFSRKAKGKYDSLQKNCSRENRTLARREGYSMMSDDSKKKIECETCGKRFNVRSKLERHMVVHTGEKRYFCDICGKGFGFRESLGEHLKRMHTDGQNMSKHRKEKICSICFKNFKSTEKLKEHMASHTSGKTFKCDLCSKSFTYKTCLLRHHHESHSRKMFSCNVCGKMFGIKPYLDEHMRFVHNLVRCVNNLEDNNDTKDDKDVGLAKDNNVRDYNDVADDNDDDKVNDQIREKSDMDLSFIMDTVLNDVQEDSVVKKELKTDEVDIKI